MTGSMETILPWEANSASAGVLGPISPGVRPTILITAVLRTTRPAPKGILAPRNRSKATEAPAGARPTYRFRFQNAMGAAELARLAGCSLAWTAVPQSTGQIAARGNGFATPSCRFLRLVPTRRAGR